MPSSSKSSITSAYTLSITVVEVSSLVSLRLDRSQYQARTRPSDRGRGGPSYSAAVSQARVEFQGRYSRGRPRNPHAVESGPGAALDHSSYRDRAGGRRITVSTSAKDLVQERQKTVDELAGTPGRPSRSDRGKHHAVVTPRVEASPDRSDFTRLGETIALEHTKQFADDIRSQVAGRELAEMNERLTSIWRVESLRGGPPIVSLPWIRPSRTFRSHSLTGSSRHCFAINTKRERLRPTVSISR